MEGGTLEGGTASGVPLLPARTSRCARAFSACYWALYRVCSLWPIVAGLVILFFVRKFVLAPLGVYNWRRSPDFWIKLKDIQSDEMLD